MHAAPVQVAMEIHYQIATIAYLRGLSEKSMQTATTKEQMEAT